MIQNNIRHFNQRSSLVLLTVQVNDYVTWTCSVEDNFFFFLLIFLFFITSILSLRKAFDWIVGCVVSIFLFPNSLLLSCMLLFLLCNSYTSDVWSPDFKSFFFFFCSITYTLWKYLYTNNYHSALNSKIF